MNSIKIEKNSIYFLKQVICNHELMDEYINDNDKEPSWDGYIYLYNTDSLKAEDIRYKIPVQIKGKNKEELLKRKSFTYPVKYEHLRNYNRHDGVFYFVIIISNDGNDKEIFYNALTPIKLQKELKGTESKGAEQTKNIVLTRLEKNSSEKLYRLLLQFGHDSQQQGSGEGELVRRAINKDTLNEIDSLRATVFDDYTNITPDEIIHKITRGEICLFGHRKDSDTWYPFSYEEQTQMQMETHIELNNSFGIGEQVFYNKISKVNDSKKEVYKLSDNITIDIQSGNVNFKPVSKLEVLKNDIEFMKALSLGNSYCIDGKKAITYDNVNIPGELQEDLDFFQLMINAFEKYEIICDKRIAEFTDKNWKAINRLLNLYLGKLKPKEENGWEIWWWNKKVYPILLLENEDDKTVHSYNFTTTNQMKLFIKDGEKQYLVPNFVIYKRDVWESLFDVDESVLINKIKECEFNEITGGEYSIVMVEILAAYDTTKNEKYYNVAKCISDKLYESNPDNQYWIINKLQIAKRKRDLTEEEIKKLEKILEKPDDEFVACAIDILLENKYNAKKRIEKLPDGDRKAFETYPIYNLLPKEK